MKVAVAAGWNRGAGPRRRGFLTRRLLTEKVGDLAQGPQRRQMFGLDRRGLWQPVLQRREDLHPLDRVDPQVVVELHVQLEHLHRVSRLLRHDLQQNLGATAGAGVAGAGTGKEVEPLTASDGRSSEMGARGGAETGAIRLGITASGRGSCGLPSCRPPRSRTADVSRCWCSSSDWNVCCVAACPSRNWRWSCAVCSASRCKATRFSWVWRIAWARPAWFDSGTNGMAAPGASGAGSGTAGREPEAKEDARPSLPE